jgi:hypothetical protein
MFSKTYKPSFLQICSNCSKKLTSEEPPL